MKYALNPSFEKRVQISKIINKINKLKDEMGGVFTFSDLWNLIGLRSSDRTAKVIDRLLREEVLLKIRRGIYTTKDPDLWILAGRFKEEACVSMDSVLSKEGLIGTLPERSVSLIYPGNTQTIETPFGRLRFFKIKRGLIFGTQRMKGGILAADKEKAYLDLLYYYVKGARFVIDPLKDVDVWKLDKNKVNRYLRVYRNPKFVKFVKGLLDENTRRIVGKID